MFVIIFIISKIELGINLFGSVSLRKLLKDYNPYFISIMWMWSIFGSYRYEWISKRIFKADCLSEPKEVYYPELIQLLNTWNPCSEKLFHLKDAIEGIERTETFSLRLICHCVKSLTVDSKHFIAWKIIDLMNSRIKKTPKSFFRVYYHDENSYILLIKNLEQIALKMPKIDIFIDEIDLPGIMLKDKIQKEIEEAKLSFLSRVEESEFKVFRIIIRLLENMKSIDDGHMDKESYGRSEFYEINFNNKIKSILLFFDNNWRINIINTLLLINIKTGEKLQF